METDIPGLEEFSTYAEVWKPKIGDILQGTITSATTQIATDSKGATLYAFDGVTPNKDLILTIAENGNPENEYLHYVHQYGKQSKMFARAFVPFRKLNNRSLRTGDTIWVKYLGMRERPNSKDYKAWEYSLNAGSTRITKTEDSVGDRVSKNNLETGAINVDTHPEQNPIGTVGDESF
jgi:hypothetical protein